MSGNFPRTILAPLLLAIASGPNLCGQAPCPIALLSARAEKDTIKLEFMNKGKVPVEQLSLACLPSGGNKFPHGICHVESGIFYPNTVSWITIDYLGASRHPPEISVTQLHLDRGTVWQPSPTNRCKALRATRKN